MGQAQAIEVAALVAAMRPDLLVSSDLQRASQTAEKVASLTGLPLTLDARLRERHLGHWQGLTRDEVASRFPGGVRRVAGRPGRDPAGRREPGRGGRPRV